MILKNYCVYIVNWARPLALWLKTARRTEPLQSLDKNIKCGNSLINDSEIAGKKAFNWNTEFDNTVNGGFDIVLGNPPYVSNKQLYRNKQDNEKIWLDSNYLSAKSGNYDLYIPFIEKGLNLLKEGGYLSFIIPNKFLVAKYSKEMLRLINENYTLVEIADFSDLNVFDDVSVYPIVIIIKKVKGSSSNVPRRYFTDFTVKPSKELIWNYIEQKPVYAEDDIISKIMHKIEHIENCNNDLSFQPGINGFQFTNYGKCITEGKTSEDDKRITVTGSIDPYILLDGQTRYKGKDYNHPYIHFDESIISEAKWKLFSSPKVLIAGMTKRIEAILDEKGQLAPAVSVYSILSSTIDLRQIEGILNSNLINWYFSLRFSDKHLAGGYLSINNILLKEIPFAKQKSLSLCQLVTDYSKCEKEFQDNQNQIIKLIIDEYNIKIGQNKLQTITELGWNEFTDILGKNKVSLDLLGKEEIYGWFKEKQSNLISLKQKKESLRNQIETEIYNIYNLNEEEINFIKNFNI